MTSETVSTSTVLCGQNYTSTTSTYDKQCFIGESSNQLICQVLLFEKATFLVVAHHMRKEHNDANRFEKISNIIKQFKLSCNKMQSFFRSIEVSFIKLFKSVLKYSASYLVVNLG